jgi:solute carrier family 25 phosphate transporter 3
VEADGPNALLVGFGPTIIGYGIEGAVKFGTYESLKRPFLSLLYDGGCGATQAYLAAAAFAGAVASIVLCPLEETRIRLVTDPSFGTGLFDGLPRLLREDGMLSPFRRGMAPMLIKQVPYTIGKQVRRRVGIDGLYPNRSIPNEDNLFTGTMFKESRACSSILQVSFDVFASLLYSTLIGMSFVPQKKIALEVEIGAAFCASVVACLASHPGDVLLTATYGNGGDPNNDTAGGIISTFRRVGERGGGLSNFFRGLDARFLHVGCIITLQLVLYDQLKQALGLPASGT